MPVFTAGDRLRKARELTGLDQEAFAEVIGVSRGTVSNYERSEKPPRPIALRAWAMATGVSVHWLKTGEGSPSDPDGPGHPSTTAAALAKLAARKRSRRGGDPHTHEYTAA